MPNRGHTGFWIDIRKMPHTRTLYMREEQIQEMRYWLRNNAKGRWYVQLNQTQRGQKTGLHSVVVYLDDIELWPQFKLTWM